MSKEEKSFLVYCKENCIETGLIDGYEFFILAAPIEAALNGYVVFPTMITKEVYYNGILTYVPVHGGITFCNHEPDGEVVYGFDTLHHDSRDFPRTDPEWIKEQISVMIKGILKAAKVESKYLAAKTNKGKAKYAQMVQDIQPEQSHNFGVSINLLSGKI